MRKGPNKPKYWRRTGKGRMWAKMMNQALTGRGLMIPSNLLFGMFDRVGLIKKPEDKVVKEVDPNAPMIEPATLPEVQNLAAT